LIKILQVLSMLPVKNRTMLEECKLLSLVKSWSEYEEKTSTDGGDNSLKNSENETAADIKEWIKTSILLELVVDRSVDIATEKAASTAIHPDIKQQLAEQLTHLKAKAQQLYDEWNNLKVRGLILTVFLVNISFFHFFLFSKHPASV
jgi:hypothetical protein